MAGERARAGAAGGVGPRAATLVPPTLLVLGGIGGGVASIFAPPVGVVAGAAAVVAAAVFAAKRGAVRRVSRWTMAAGTAGVVAIAVALFAVAAAVAAARLDPWALVGAGLAYAALAGALWARALRRRADEWEVERRTNERQVLDLGAGTFDPERGFRFGSAPGPPWQRLVDRWAPVAGPVVVALFAGAGRRGSGDAREWVLVVVGLAVLLGVLPVVAQGVVTVRKLREYERALGREIVNR